MTMAQTQPVSDLLQAKYRGDDARVQEILATGIELDVFEAAAVGRTARVRMLVASDPSLVNRHAADGFFPLALAVFFGHADTAAAILEAGADVNLQARESMRIAALHSAVAVRRLDLVTLLLAHGADPDARAAGGLTPLHSAASGGQADLVRALIDRGADVNAADEIGRTPLALALEKGNQDATALLRERGGR